MNQLFYNIAGGIVRQTRREKRITISDAIVRGKRNIKQNRNWFSFKFSVESSSFILQTSLSFVWFYQSAKLCCISPSYSETNRDGADAESPFPLFFSFSASFKNSSPREKVAKLSLFGTGEPSCCLYPLLSRNIIFFPCANNVRSREKKNIYI